MSGTTWKRKMAERCLLLFRAELAECAELFTWSNKHVHVRQLLTKITELTVNMAGVYDCFCLMSQKLRLKFCRMCEKYGPLVSVLTPETGVMHFILATYILLLYLDTCISGVIYQLILLYVSQLVRQETYLYTWNYCPHLFVSWGSTQERHLNKKCELFNQYVTLCSPLHVARQLFIFVWNERVCFWEVQDMA